MACTSDNHALAPSPLLPSADSHPYGPSIPSPASSSASSIFSLDAPSSQSSTASSSTSSVNVIWANEHESWGHRQSHESSHGVSGIGSESSQHYKSAIAKLEQSEVQPRSQAVAPEFRKHPRRTHRDSEGNDRSGAAASACPRPPPALVRQCERKDNFVDSLVGKIYLRPAASSLCLPSSSQRYHDSDD